jgi:hypothetical protein
MAGNTTDGLSSSPELHVFSLVFPVTGLRVVWD